MKKFRKEHEEIGLAQVAFLFGGLIGFVVGLLLG